MSPRSGTPVGAPRKRAAHLLATAGAIVPVPVSDLLEDHASLQLADLPGSCEAMLLTAADGSREAIIRASLSTTPRRLRFTQAHLLGHIALCWHVGPTCCHTHPDTLGDLSTVDAIIESEASAFAMELMMPGPWLRQIVRDTHPCASIRTVADEAEVPLPIAARAAARLMEPGLVWAIADEHRYVHFSGSSPGTLAPLPARGLPLDAADVGRRATRRESLPAHDRVLWCWRLDGDPAIHETSAALLRAIAADLGMSEATRGDVFDQVHGVAGFATERVAVVPAGELREELSRRLRDRGALSPITSHPLFAEFVRTRAAELAGRRVGW